VGNDTLA